MMRQEFVLGTIADIMGWDNGQSTAEFAWLRLMSRLKYDDYQDLLAGVRFLESLADWLQQFPFEERSHAYRLVRRRLVFFSAKEMRHLVELFYPETVEPRLMAKAAELARIPYYDVWADSEARTLVDRLLKKSVFVELSDGARADILRRLNEGRISNEQVVTSPQITQQKWDDMLDKLRTTLGDPHERFSFVFLMDDFTASGTTLLRKENNVWKGKLERFWHETRDYMDSHFAADWILEVHHYIATQQAITTIQHRNQQRAGDSTSQHWFPEVRFSCGMSLSDDLRLRPGHDPDLDRIVKTYYDPAVETQHLKKGGKDARWGFAQCGLPVVLEHNTPNNSLALLWAETDNPDGHSMRPLFRRRQRHV